MNQISESAKLKLICFSLLLILGLLALTAVRTVQAVRSFQWQYSEVKTGDVSTVHPWMTVHVISHVYHVPEAYLRQKLTIKNPDQSRHATLYEIASNKRQPVEHIVRTVQNAILTYRKEKHTTFFMQPAPLPVNKEPLLVIPGGMNA